MRTSGAPHALAVQYVRPDRLDTVLARKTPPIQWLSERAVGVLLRELGRDRSAWRHENDIGQFSLSGAQPKTALLRDGRRWGILSGRMPTMHILKPPSDRFPGHVENEHFCLMLARQLGLNTAVSEVLEFDGAVAIVIERFDRVTQGKEVQIDNSDPNFTAHDRLPDAPRWTLSAGAQYTWILPNAAALVIRLDTAYRSKTWKELYNLERSSVIQYFGNAATATPVQSGTEGYYGRPREWGLTVSYRFGS